MLDSPGSPTEASTTDRAAARVVAFVAAVEGAPLDDTVLALASQVYEVSSIVVIGADDTEAGSSSGPVVEHVPTFRDALDRLEPTDDLVWFVHGDAIPRPDALGSLVFEMERNDASMVGSKILDAEEPTRLESVGAATDVFGEPYTGLDPDEVDLEQYDVVRDVSFVSGVSVLIRRDLLRGLRGTDPLLPPVAAGMDLSQRARIAGGRVMVVPSSEVLHQQTCGHDVAGWRELAGRMRAMWKAYRLLTLAWVAPLGALIGLFDGVVRLVLGRAGPLADFVRAIGWNLTMAGSTISQRSSLRRVRQASDEELFRYQVSGSLRLRDLITDLAERFGWVIDEDEGIVTEEQLADDSTAAGPLIAGATLVVLALAARALWFGAIPAVGFSLPNHHDLTSVLGSWAGGWNPAGLGSSMPTHPSVALSAAAELVAGGWSGARSALTVVSMVLGVLALGSLLRRVGADGPSRHLAGILLFLGTGAAAIADSTDWGGFVAIGPAVWMLDLVMRPWPSDLRTRLGQVGAIVVAAIVTGMAAPLVPVVVAVMAVVGWLTVQGVGPTTVVRALVGVGAGFAAAAPYLLRTAPDAVAGRGPQLVPDLSRPGWIALAVTALAAVVVVSGNRWRVISWGAFGVFAPPVVLTVTGWSGDAAIALGVGMAVGGAVVVGTALGFDDDGGRTLVGLRAATVLAASTAVLLVLAPVGSGRAGFPQDRWTDRLDFVDSFVDEAGPGRVLLVGDGLPGEYRTTEHHRYRLVTGSVPTMDQARLALPRLGDQELDAVVEEILAGGVVRPGALLADFAVQWVVIVGDVSASAGLDTQVDLVPIPVAEDMAVYRNTVYGPRAVATDGSEWTAGRVSAVGAASDATVRWADNASGRWSPGWSQQEWFNVVSASDGELVYRPDSTIRLLAWSSMVLLALGAILGVWGRARR